MLFNSEIFLFYFFPLLAALYYYLPKLRNTILLAGSLIFYAWGEIEYTLVLISSIVFNYYWAIRISSGGTNRKMLFLIGIAINLLVLIFFKYFNFLTGAAYNALYGQVSVAPVYDIHLPLGISFFTFQAISYLFDVYRKTVKADGSLTNIGLYIACFPQLIAGPIVRYKTIAAEIKKRTLTHEKTALGIQYFIIGLAQKTLIANVLAKGADQAFNMPIEFLNPLLAWEGAILYTFQIYYDFSGYSNMAIGLGLILGFHFPKNFDFPYMAASITDFWRRWHITLSSWFKDYLYIPLGGNRQGRGRTAFNLLTVFFLCGFWHGASWNFIVWGLYHGLFLSFEKIGVIPLKYFPRVLKHFYTMWVVIIGWVFFRAEDIDTAISYIKHMFFIDSSAVFFMEMTRPEVIVTLAIAIFFSTPYMLRKIESKDAVVNDHDMMNIAPTPTHIRTIVLMAILALCMLKVVIGAYNPFIYFRF